MEFVNLTGGILSGSGLKVVYCLLCRGTSSISLLSLARVSKCKIGQVNLSIFSNQVNLCGSSCHIYKVAIHRKIHPAMAYFQWISNLDLSCVCKVLDIEYWWFLLMIVHNLIVCGFYEVIIYLVFVQVYRNL